ncbi:MAG TPA: flavin reductase family protein [Bryobacteraceae bacterium]|nr:flavin reductase family protein [Bryobacteraceae bacterium]
MPRRTRPESLTKTEFCRACAKFPTGVTIVTVLDAEGCPHGMTASSFTSVSLEPPLVLVCVDHRASVLAHLRRAQHISINILSEGQQDLSAHFARPGHDRFTGVEWEAGQGGVPLISGALARFECSIHRMVDAGDHTILIAEVLDADYCDGRPLVYFGSGYHKLDGETAS